jgi:cobalamin biosynthesis Mg chelatase CobN
LTAGAIRARRTLAALALALGSTVLLAGWAAPASAQDDGGDPPITVLPPGDPTTTTVSEEPTTTTVANTTTSSSTSAAPVVTAAPTTTRPAPRPTTTSVVEVEITTTTLGVTTSTNLLVPGDGTEGAESTTTTETIAAVSDEDSGLSDGTLIGIVVAGLVLIAIVVGILTWRYWAATRPTPIEADGHPAPAG